MFELRKTNYELTFEDLKFKQRLGYAIKILLGMKVKIKRKVELR